MTNRLAENKVYIPNSLLNHHKEFVSYITKLPIKAIVLDNQRRVVLFSDGFKSFFQNKKEFSPIGKEPGEVIECKNAILPSQSCGTSSNCISCGINKAIKQSYTNKGPVSFPKEITNSNSEATKHNYNISATPLYTANDTLTLIHLDDTSDIKKIYSQEYSFYHELLDKVSNLSGAVDLAEYKDDKELMDEGLKIIRSVTNLMQEEILEQKHLLAVESGEYNLIKEPFIVDQLLEPIKIQIESHLSEKECKLFFKPKENDLICECDQTLLRRVIVSLLKVAIRESCTLGCIYLDYTYDKQNITFTIKHDGYISLMQQMMYFQNFNVPGGKKNYTDNQRIRKITEEFLHGYISYKTDEKTGTSVSIHIPLQ